MQLQIGKEFDCLTFVSESGGITDGILVEILKYFDSLGLFPRVPGGPIPMLILDLHQSRLDPSFIKYINRQDHGWRVFLGVPYATVLWQVGDASEQNGKFKTEWYRVKEDVMKWKAKYNLPRTLGPTDIIPLMNKIYSTNRTAMSLLTSKPWFLIEDGFRRTGSCWNIPLFLTIQPLLLMETPQRSHPLNLVLPLISMRAWGLQCLIV